MCAASITAAIPGLVHMSDQRAVHMSGGGVLCLLDLKERGGSGVSTLC